MAGGIFISYRREDSQHAAGRLVDRLTQSFGRDRIFMDVDAIEPGLDFEEVINSKLAESAVLLAVIGPGWINAVDRSGNRRLDNPDDLVRVEIEAGLKRGIRVIPVLVDGAPMPASPELPPALQTLARRQSMRISHEAFGTDADRLIATLARLPGIPEGASAEGKSARSPEKLEFTLEQLVKMTETIPADKSIFAWPLFKWPEIPPAKEANARSAAGVPLDEAIAVLVDMTAFGSAKNSFLLGKRGWYFRHWPRAASMNYNDLNESQLSKGWSWVHGYVVTIGRHTLVTDRAGRARIFDLLHALQERIRARM